MHRVVRNRLRFLTLWMWSIAAIGFSPTLTHAQCTAPDSTYFLVDTLVKASSTPNPGPLYAGTATDSGPIGMAIAPDGSIFIPLIGSGRLMVYRPSSNTTVHVGNVPSAFVNGETGFNGIAIDPSYPTTHWIYTLYVENTTHNITEMVNGVATSTPMRSADLVRYTVDSTQAAGSQLTNPKIILQYQRESSITQHMGGGLSMNQDGTLVFGTGEGSNYNAANANGGYGPMYWPYPTEDSQRSSSNTNDLRGKIIRIKPIPFPDNETPDTGVGSTYTIPSGNFRQLLSSASSPTSVIPGWDTTDDSTKIRPEIYDFGVRVPIHARVDPRSGWIFWGDVGPNAPDTSTTRGPAGHDEWNLATTPGFFGYPYCNGYNSAYNMLTSTSPNNGNASTSGTYGHLYDCETALGGVIGGDTLAPMVNYSPNNTGIHHMPPALPSLVAYAGTGSNGESSDHDDDVRFNAVYTTTGAADHDVASAFGGQMYRYDPGLPSTVKFPPYYEGKIIYFDFVRQNTRIISIGTNGTIPAGAAGVQNFPGGLIPSGSYTDMQFGPDGALYVLRYSTSYVPSQNIGTGGGLYKIVYNSTAHPYNNSCYTPFVATVGPVGAASVPNVPTGATGVAGNGQASLSWTAPTVNGNSSITSYTATSTQDTSKHCTTSGTSCTATGLANGTAYTFTVTATNSIGTSLVSAASNSITPASATVPGAPVITSAVPGNAQVTLNWTAPSSNGGATITAYTATSQQDTSKHCTTATTSCAVIGLTNGTPYTFTVTATNSVGTGPASTPSSSVTPLLPPTTPVINTQPQGTTVISGSLASFTVAATGNGTLYYQWQKDGVNLVNSAGHLSGATTATLTDSSVASTDTGTYTVLVTDSLNGTSAANTSSGAYMTVNSAPNISAQPAALTKLVGGIGSFTVTASGAGHLGYQWQKDGVNASNSAGHLSGVTGATLTDSSVTAGDTGTYKVIVTDTLNGTTASTVSVGAYLTVNSIPSISVPPLAQTKTVGSGASFSVTASGQGSLGYQWQKNGVNVSDGSGGTTSSFTLASVVATDTGTYMVVVTDTLNGTVSSAASSGAYLTINFAPSINAQPSALTKTVGASASFTVTATGAGHLGYEWQKDGVNVSDGSGATTSAFTLSAVAATDTGTYTVVVTDTLNGTLSSTTSSGAYLTLNSAPSISAQPSALTKTAGASASFAVTAAGAGHLGYEWQKNGVNVSDGSGAMTSSFMLSSVVATDSGTYTVVVTDTLNGTVSSTVSNGAYLTINSAPNISAQPSALTRTLGSSASFTVTASGMGHLGYQWQKNGVNVSDGSGATTSAFTLSAIAATDTGTYTVVVTDTVNGSVSSTTSSGAYLTINAPPNISAQPSALTKTIGGSASFTVTASGVGHLGYQWLKNGVNVSDGNGGATSTFALSSVASTDTGTYTVVVTDTLNGTVSNTTSNGVYLTLNTAPVISLQPLALTKILGAGASFTVAASGQGSLGYQWQKNGVNVSDGSGGTTATFMLSSVASTDTGTYAVVITDTLNGTFASTTSSGAYLTLNPAPSISAQPAALTKILGASASFTVTASGAGHLGYQWQKNGANVSDGSGGTTSTFALSSVASTDTGTYTVVVMDTLNGTTASITSNGAYLTLNSAPGISVQPVALTKILGTSASFTVTASGAGHLGYQWQKNGVNVSDGSGGTTSTFALSSVVATDSGTYAVMVTDTLGGTVSNTVSNGAYLTVTAAPPVINNQPVASQTKISGASASFTVAATGSSTLVYQWQKNGVNVSDGSGATTATFSLASVVASDSGTYAVNITDSVNGSTASVTSSNSHLAVTAAPPVIGTQPVASQSKTLGSNVSFTVAATGGGNLAYQWQKNGVNVSDGIGATTATFSLIGVAASDSGTYTVIVTDSLNSSTASVTSNGARLTVTAAPPNIGSGISPASLTKTLGSSAGFTVIATGSSNLAFQWQKDGVNVSVGTVNVTEQGSVGEGLLGATSSFSFTGVVPSDSGTYTVIVTDSLNGSTASVTSNGARLTVTAAPPVIEVQPVSLVRPLGSSASFTVTASGPSLAYQWQKGGVNVSDGAGGNTATFSLASVVASDSGTYTVIVTDTVNGTTANVTSGNAHLAVTAVPPVIGTQPVATQSKTLGSSASFTVAATGTGNLAYQWRKGGVNVSDGAGGNTATFSLASVVASDSGTYTVIVTDTVNGSTASDTSNGSHLAVTAAPPVIGTQPVATQSRTLGSGASFTVAATGSGNLAYQWQKGGVNVGDGSGATTATFSIASVMASDSGTYMVIVTDTLNGSIARDTSSGAHLTVTAAAPVIDTQPVATQSKMFGSNASFTVAATGSGKLAYQWQKGGVNVGDSSGATTATFSIASVAASDSGTYRVIVTDTVNGTTASVTSSSSHLAVTAASPVITAQPVSLTRPLGSAASFTVTASAGGALGYQWGKLGGGSLSDGTGVTTATFSLATVVASDSGTYAVIVTDTVNGTTAEIISTATHLTVTAVAPTINTQPVSLTRTPGGSASFTVAASGGGSLGYQWQKNGVNVSDGTGATTPTFALAPVLVSDSGIYTVIVTDSVNGTTANVTSAGAHLAVIAGAPVISAQPVALTRTLGSSASFTVAAIGGGALSYRWQKGGVNVSDGAGATTSTFTLASVVASDSGTYTVIVTDTVNGTTANVASNGAHLTVTAAPPVIGTQPASSTEVLGTSASFTVAATGSGTLAYQWQKNGVNVSDGNGATTSTFTLSSVAATDTGTYTVVVTDTLNGSVSSATSSGAYLTLNPPPSISAQPSALTRTVGSNASFTVTASGSGHLGYQWQKNSVNVSDGSGAATSSFTLSSVAVADTGTYMVVVTDTLNGTVSSITSSGVYLTLNSAPSISIQPSAITQTVGSIGSFTVTASGSGVLTYQWQRDGVNVVNSAGHISGATMATLTDSSIAVADTGTYTVIVTNTLNSTSSSTSSSGAYLTVNAAPSISIQPVAITKAVGAVGTFSVTASGSGILTYQWQRNGVNVSNNAGHISGATMASLTDSSVAATDTGTYNVIVTSTLNGVPSSATSSGAYLTVNTAPSVSVQPIAITKAVGAVGTFSVTASGSGVLTYQWQRNGVNVSNSAGHISGATTATLTDSSVAATDTGTYTVIVTNTLNSTSSSTPSSGAYLTVNAAPTISVQPAPITKAVGGMGSFSVTASSNGTLTYQWQRDGVNVLSSTGHFSGAMTATLTDSSVAGTDSGTYTVVVTSTLNSVSSSVTSSGAYLTVNVVPSISAQPVPITKAVGSIGSFSVAATGNGALTFQWQKNGVNVSNTVGHISGATTANLIDSSVASTDTGTYTVVVTNTLNATTSFITSAGVYLTVNAAPSISAQPIALTKTLGGSASFTVTASGAGHLGYQWQKNGVNVSDGSGATTPSFTLSSVAATDTGTYTVVVTDTLNGTTSSITSSGAYLTFNSVPIISTQPLALTKALGASASFTVTVSGAGHLGYQWQKNGVNVSDGSGATTPSFTLSSVVASDTGTYTVEVTDTLNGTTSSVTSSGAYLTLNAVPGISVQPLALTKTLGTNASFTVTASGAGHLGYQWQKNGVNVSDGSGATTPSFTLSSVVASDTGTYTVVVTDTLNGTTSSITSSGAYLTLNPAPNIGVQPLALTKTIGASASFTVTASGAGHLGYQWQKNGVNVSDGSGATMPSFTLSSVVATDTGTYTVVVTDTLNGTTSSITSSGAYLTLNPAPSIGVQPVAITKVLGASASFTVTASGSGMLSYQWQKNGVNLSNSAGHISGVTAATLTDSLVAAADTGTYMVTVTNALNGTTSSVTSNGVYLTVNAAPSISVQPVAITKTMGSIGTFSVTASGSGVLTYQWQKDGVNLANSAGHFSGASAFVLTDSSVSVADTGIYMVTVTNTLNGTTSSTSSGGAYLTVNAAPSISVQPSALTKAAGASASFTVTASGTGHLGYQWQKNGINVSDGSGAMTSAFTLSSVATTDTGTYTVVVTDTLNGTISSATSIGAYLTLNAAPNISVQPLSLTKTVGSIGIFTVTASGSGVLSYQWQKNGVNLANSAGHLSGATTAILTDSSVAATDSGTYIVLVTNTLNATTSSVTSSGAYLTVNTAPTIITQPSKVKIAAGGNAAFSVTANGGIAPLGYQWYENALSLNDTTGLSGSKTTTLAFTGLAGPDSGNTIANIMVVVSSAGNGGSVSSSVTTLTVNALPKITTQPANAILSGLGQTASFSVVAIKGFAPLAYQWFKGGVVLTDSGRVSGSKTATLTLTNIMASDTGVGLYHVVVTNADSVGSVTSTTVGFEVPTALLAAAMKAAAIRMMGSSLVFQLPSGIASAQISIIDVWGRAIWSQNLGKGANQLTWNGKSSNGASTGSGLYVVRMVLFDAGQHQIAIIERKIAFTP